MNFSEYDKDYFVGGTKSGYGNYEYCSGIMVDIYNATIGSIEYRPKTYLDVGCAYGFTVDIARRHGTEAYGVEPPTYALEVAKSKPWGQHMIEDSLPLLENLFSDDREPVRTFELVSAFEVLEHIPKDELKDSMKSLWALTSKYLVVLPCTGHVDQVVPPTSGDVTHISVLTKETWNKIFDELNLTQFRDKDAEERFNNNPVAKRMFWSGRYFVFKRP